MYDPNNPITPPDGGYAITSVPGGSPSVPGGGRPGTPPMGYPSAPTQAPRTPNPNKGPGLSPGGMPPLPGGGGMPQVPGFPSGGGLTPGGMPPIPGVPGASGVPGMDGRGEWNMGDMSRDQRMQARDARRAYMEQFKNSIFQWLAARPSDPSQMQAWIAQRPQFSRESMMAAMFAPTAPATGTTPAPTSPPPTL